MRPNGALRWILTRITSRDVADATIGDILEELDDRAAAGHGPRRPRAWLASRLVLAIVAGFASAAPPLLRSAGFALRDAARSLRRTPSSALFILSILALGIAAGTVAFSVVDAVVLKPLPIEHSERIVTIRWYRNEWAHGIWPEDFLAIRDHVPAFDGVAYAFGRPTPVGVGAATFDATVLNCTSDEFRVFGITPTLGRLWTPAEDGTGPDVAILSDRLWRTRFGADPAATGRTIQIFKRAYEVIGVAQKQAGAIGDGHDIDIWVPATRQFSYEVAQHNPIYAEARLRPAVTIDEARRQILAAIAPQMAARPADYRDARLDVDRWDIALIGADTRNWLLLLLGVVGLIVLIACANASNVMLTRSAERARDLAIRASLGASRKALAMSVLLESLLLSFAAGGLALLISLWGVGAAKAALPPGPRLFRSGTIALDGRVFIAALAAAIATGLLFGAVPAWQASRASVLSLLNDGGTRGTARSGWRALLLTGEIGCVGTLLVLCSLFIGSFIHVLTLDLGIDRSHLLAISTVSDYQGTVDDLQARLAAVPGLTGAAAVTMSSLPLVGSAYGGAWFDTPVDAVDPPPGMGSRPVTVDVYRVTPNLFQVAGIPMLHGSAWRSGVASDPRPMVVDELAARRLFGSSDPIGRRIHAAELKNRTFVVTGVVQHTATMGPEGPTRAAVYYDMLPGEHPTWVGFLVRTAGPPALLAHSVDATLAEVSRPDSSAGAGVHVVDDGFSRLTATRRFTAGLMSAFALFALFIGAAGIYAVIASIVAQQTKEIGVRVALGATTGDIRRGVLARTGRYVLGGIAIGLPAGWLVSRGVASLFFQITPTDPSIYLLVAATLVIVAFLAAIVPARRAASVDPVVSLRAS